MDAQESSGPVDGHAPAHRGLQALPFPPVTKQHLLNCSYHSWHPRYRAVTPKARLIPVPPALLDYLRADGIVLPPGDSGILSGADKDGADPSMHWRATHQAIEHSIADLGGTVAPKLNWSAPKDATWIAATNSMECRTPNDIYLLLKSSDFVTHDLAHAFDDTADPPSTPDPAIPYHLVLRKWITLNPSLEFRCFVRNRRLIALCQRDLNHFDFLFAMEGKLRHTIQHFFHAKLRHSFPDPNFTFDVYVPPPHDKVWLVDFNPWAVRTDPLLFSWMELLTMEVPDAPAEASVMRLPIAQAQAGKTSAQALSPLTHSSSPHDSDESDVEELWQPEFRMVRRDDPEASAFSTPQYSAHKLPKDVVDASSGGGQLREFARQWEQAQKLAEQQGAEHGEED